MGKSAMPQDPQVINLNKVLASQERVLLSESLDSSNFKSRYERARIRANFDYARSLLLTVSSTKKLPKDDIQRKRDLVKRLQARLNELDHLYAQEDEEECESCDEEEHEPTKAGIIQEPEGMRQRGQGGSSAIQPTATTTSSNRYSQAFPRSKSSATRENEESDWALKSRESKISSHDRERAELQTSLLNLAVQLKQSARGFGASIEQEKGTLNAAILGLDKSVGGMEGAGGKMDSLRRETEGVGWWRRMRLYVEVGGLWLLAVLLVFVFPKLRF
ncbi:uncharacterized protein PV09_06946 [Verruconis gallopava]|uniref:t-SNARE coiled-coil homology domain-containing protein n=1 Tax=Verruconis gallopava TaxID=253628 RepID=A0A0D2ARE9_9PEZI|nr:uncharacterized protein PV09_06946 [Verruconis gallopava]KIW01774.1 hypothetical protein PV09_06946 [Verruconis gallopava]